MTYKCSSYFKLRAFLLGHFSQIILNQNNNNNNNDCHVIQLIEVNHPRMWSKLTQKKEEKKMWSAKIRKIKTE